MITLEDAGYEVAGESVEILLPTFVDVTKAKRKSCNLNEYRNLHHHLLNKQKINFKAKVKKAIEALDFMDTIAIHYTVFAQRNGRMDTMNVGSVIDKYFSDALVELNKLEDDDYTHIVWNSFSFGGVSKGNPHAIATITPVRKKADMRILLEQTEVIDALLAELTEEQMQVALGNYVRNTIGLEPKDIVISSEEELTVEIFAGPSSTAPAEKPKAKPKTTRRRKPKPAPEKDPEEDKDVDGSPETGSDDSGEGTGGGADQDAPAPETGPEEPPKTTKSALFDDDGDGEETTAAPETESKGKPAKNLFTDEENQSSSDQSDENGGGDENSEPVKTDKRSIFDV